MTHPLTADDTAVAASIPLVGLGTGPSDAEARGQDVVSATRVSRFSSDEGMSTVEYAVGTVVAAAFAAVLYRIVTGDSIVAGLTNLVQSALNTSF